jgi:site-specific DNA-methyltransferase (adenine-specific)
MAISFVSTGDSRKALQFIPDGSADSVITDPPYEINIVGSGWDRSGVAFDSAMWGECLRILKPGGYLLSFGGTRTYHRIASAIEDAGFDIKDQMMWVFGSGFPKSFNVSKAFAKLGMPEESAKWEGFGTALKPAHEPIVVARKPIPGTICDNLLQFGTGAMNTDACRVGDEEVVSNQLESWSGFGELKRPAYTQTTHVGRFPANFIHDGSDEVVELFPDAPGAKASVAGDEPSDVTKNVFNKRQRVASIARLSESSTSAARFFYCAKPSKKERNAGLSGDNKHPTVKPVSLLRYLVRLFTPPGGTVLDPFTGSGTTGMACAYEGFDFRGIELYEEHTDIAKMRIAFAVADALKGTTE